MAKLIDGTIDFSNQEQLKEIASDMEVGQFVAYDYVPGQGSSVEEDLALLPELIGEAMEHGQLGNVPFLGEVDANTLTESGWYLVDTLTNDNWNINHWPFSVSLRTLVGVWTESSNNNVVYQKIITPWFSCIRRNWYGNWSDWVVDKISTGNAAIFISKNGSDLNLGLSSSSPVLNVKRAVEVANSLTLNNPNISIVFYFGAGDWGDITFTSIPYAIQIRPYSGSSYNEFSEELPHFGKLTFNGCSYVGLISPNIDYLVLSNSFAWVAAGFYRIKSFYASAHSIFSLNTNPDGIFEIGDPSPYTNIIFDIESGSTFSFNKVNFRLCENVGAISFIYMNHGGRLITYSEDIGFDPNGHTFAGKKCTLHAGDQVITPTNKLNSDGVPSIFERFFGTDYTVDTGVIFNGIANNAVNKAGDTMTGPLNFVFNKTEAGNLYKSLVYDRENLPASRQSITIFDIRDKNDKLLRTQYIAQFSDGNVDFQDYFYGKGNTYVQVVMRYNLNSNKFTYCIPQPDNASNGVEAVTSAWVNSKLGSAASLIALATLDETAENYVETFETRKLKAIAQLNAEAQQAIYAGFEYEINGQPYMFGYSIFDQINLQNKAILALHNIQDSIQLSCNNQEGYQEQLTLTPAQILDIFKFAENYKQGILNAVGEKRNRILSAKTDNQLNAILKG